MKKVLFNICLLLLFITGQASGQKVYRDKNCRDYQCFNDNEVATIESYLLHIYQVSTYRINIVLLSSIKQDNQASFDAMTHNGTNMDWVGDDGNKWFDAGQTNGTHATLVFYPGVSGKMRLSSSFKALLKDKDTNKEDDILWYTADNHDKNYFYPDQSLCFIGSLLENMRYYANLTAINKFKDLTHIDCINGKYSNGSDIPEPRQVLTPFQYLIDGISSTNQPGQSIREINLFKSRFANDVKYLVPFQAYSYLKPSVIQGFKAKLESKKDASILVVFKSDLEHDPSKYIVSDIFGTSKQSFSTPAIPKDRGYPAYYNLNNGDLSDLAQYYNSGDKTIKDIIAKGEPYLQLLLLGRGEELNKSNKQGIPKEKSAASTHTFQSRSKEYGRWDKDFSIADDADPKFKDKNGVSQGGYNYAKLDKNEIEKLLLGIQKSNNSPYTFEIITSAESVAGSKEKAKTAYDGGFSTVPNSSPSKIYAGKIWLHEEKGTSQSSWSTSVRFNPSIFPSNGDANTFKTISKDGAEIAASIMGDASYQQETPKLPGEDFMADVMKGLSEAFTCSLDPLNAQTVWAAPSLRPKADGKMPNSYEIMMDFMTILGETLGSSISLPDRVWLPSNKQQANNYCVIDMGGGVAGMFNGASQGAVTAIQLSTGASAFKQALFISAIIKAVATGDKQMLTALRYPLVGMVTAYKGYLTQLAKPCSGAECCEEKTNASIGLIVNFVTDLISGSFVQELLNGTSVKKFASDCQTTAQNYKHPDIFMQKMKAESEQLHEDIGKRIEAYHQKVSDWINGKGLNAEQIDHWKKDVQHNPSIEAININPHNLGLPVETVHRALEAINEAGMTPKEQADYKKIIETDFVGSNKEANFKAFLEAMAAPLSAGLQGKLGASGSGKLKMWAYQKGKSGGITYKAKDGTITTGAAAVTQIHLELEARVSVSGTVLNTIVDNQGRMSVQTNKGGETNTVFSLETNKDGHAILAEYSPGFNESKNQYGVLQSDNLIAPDYKKTYDSDNTKNYFYDKDPSKYTVEIEMTGSRNGDFSSANSKCNLSSKPENYTWHHLDNLRIEVVNGQKKYFCTMQLVESQKHNNSGGAGNSHTGSAKQYEYVTGTPYKK